MVEREREIYEQAERSEESNGDRHNPAAVGEADADRASQADTPPANDLESSAAPNEDWGLDTLPKE